MNNACEATGPSRWLLLVGVLVGSGWLSPFNAALAATEEDARAVVETAGSQMIQLIGEQRAELERDPALLYQLVEDVLLPHFDFETIARLVLGKYWRTASPDQRGQFTQEFKTLLVRSYATAWLEYEGEEIRFLPPHPSRRSDRSVVRVELIDPYSAPIAFTYSLHNISGPWLVYDVAVDGVSLLANYRVSIATNVKAKGLDTTIAEIEERNTRSVAK